MNAPVANTGAKCAESRICTFQR